MKRIVNYTDTRRSPTATSAWLDVLRTVLHRGSIVSPRGMKTMEVQHASAAFPIAECTVVCPPRRLSKKFMAAEAIWITDGDDRVDTIAPYCEKIAEFSDDGKRFFGAYGPRIEAQFDYVVSELTRDRDSRRATLTIWRESPPDTKDVPCTVAMTFAVRDGALNAHVYMRSSDAWLGVPYDFFNFAMIAVKVACHLNERTAIASATPRGDVALGTLFWTAASSHLYERDWSGALACSAWEGNVAVAEADDVRAVIEVHAQTSVPRRLVQAGAEGWAAVRRALVAARESDRHVTWPSAPR